MDTTTVLGNGSFGIVHSAVHWDGTEAAAKRIDANEPARISQMSRDLEKLMGLDHDNIAKMFDILQEKATVWVFMELCTGEDLVKYMAERKSGGKAVCAVEKLKLMLDISKGVEYLHSNHVIHRDVKPSNVLITWPPVTAKLTDFDCSKFFEEPFSTSVMTSKVGTQAFKAPEFFDRTPEGKLFYHRTVDVFSMGLTFLAMIQENEYLVPRIETANNASELFVPVGLLLWERKTYKTEPLSVAKHVNADNNRLWGEVRREINHMTRAESRDRPCAPLVAQKFAALLKKYAEESDSLYADDTKLSSLSSDYFVPDVDPDIEVLTPDIYRRKAEMNLNNNCSNSSNNKSTSSSSMLRWRRVEGASLDNATTEVRATEADEISDITPDAGVDPNATHDVHDRRFLNKAIGLTVFLVICVLCIGTVCKVQEVTAASPLYVCLFACLWVCVGLLGLHLQYLEADARPSAAHDVNARIN